MIKEPWFWILLVALAVGLFFPFIKINNRALRIVIFCSLMWILLVAAAVVLKMTFGTG